MIWLIFYTDEFGTPKMMRHKAKSNWESIVDVINRLQYDNKWSVTRVELFKLPFTTHAKEA